MFVSYLFSDCGREIHPPELATPGPLGFRP
jgi:hypothetical protein